MRAVTRTLVGAGTAVGICLLYPLAVNNLGLSKAQAKNLQRVLHRDWGYSGPIDGLLGTGSWQAMQRYLKKHWQYRGPIDGIVGSGTVKGLQRMLKQHYGYRGDIDGIAGPQTKAAFKRFANDYG